MWHYGTSRLTYMYHGILLQQKYIHAHVHVCVQAFICTCTLHLPTISIITKRMIPIIPANSNHNYSKEWKYNCREVIHTIYIHSQISHETSYNTCSWHNIIQDTCTSSTHVHVLYMYMRMTYCTCTNKSCLWPAYPPKRANLDMHVHVHVHDCFYSTCTC